ncbi:MAG TPA: PAS domain-containing protein, partial [Acidobacteria bacterium]|nr:PAS domain-containing protein [Acidobacteriota bacterium]
MRERGEGSTGRGGGRFEAEVGVAAITMPALRGWSVMVRIALRCMVFLVLGLGMQVAGAQHYQVDTYTVEDGLLSPVIHHVLQDARGRIWLATRGGVTTFDGVDWITYTTADGLPSPGQKLLALDDRGALWSASGEFPVRVARFDGRRWHALPPAGTFQRNPVRLVGMRVRHEADGVRVLLVLNIGVLQLWDGRQWRETPLDLGGGRVRDVIFRGGKAVYATDAGLFEQTAFVADAALRRVAGAPQEKLFAVEDDPSGGLWLVGSDWVGHLDDGAFEVRAHRLPLGNREVGRRLATAADRKGGLYVADLDRLHYVAASGEVETFGDDSGLIDGGALSLLVDREGLIWVAGMRGLSKLVSRRFANFDASEGLLADEVTSILPLSDGQVVLGHMGGLTYWPSRRQVVLGRSLLNSRVLDLAPAEDGSFYVAVNWLGLAHVSGDQVRWISLDAGEPAAEQAVTAIEPAGDGGYYLATSRGLGWWHPVRGFRPIDLGSARPGIRALHRGPGGLWVMTSHHGIYLLGPGDAPPQHWLAASDDRANSTFCVLERGRGRVLVGTAAGLFEIGAGGLEPARPAGEIFERPVYLLLEDAASRLWIGTDSGCYRLAEGRLQRFGVSDGLIGGEANRTAGWAEPGGHVWIGTDRGLSIYRPEFDDGPRARPLLELLETEAAGRRWSMPAGQVIDLRQPARTLVFRFRAISFLDERRVRFRTWLEGFEPEWRSPRSIPRQELLYTSLPPGSYRLHVQAVAVDGQLSEERISPLIVIRPPFWQRPLFIVGATVFAGLFLIGLVSLIHQRRYMRRIERDVHRRTADLAASREALQREKERLAATLTAISDGVLVVNAEGRIALCNPAAGQALGTPAAELVGQLAPSWLMEGERPQVTLAGPGDQCRVFERSITPLGLGSATGGTSRVVAFRDVTERVRTEQELLRAQKLESLGLLAGGIAHDFNNLLTVILGNLSVVCEEVEDRRLAEGLADAERACRAARELTDQLLTFSKGGQSPREPVSLEALVRETMPLALSGSSVRGEIQVDSAVPPVEVNRGQMVQVLSNLLINAVQATRAADGGAAGKTVTVRLRGVEDESDAPGPGQWVLLEVQDEGVGIGPDDLPRIFDPYYSTKPGGHGLGLAVAHSVVRRHDGYLRADSRRGRGSVFRVWLPASHGAVSPTASGPPEHKIGRLRILLMDDEPAIRRILTQMLERLGHQVETVA